MCCEEFASPKDPVSERGPYSELIAYVFFM